MARLRQLLLGLFRHTVKSAPFSNKDGSDGFGLRRLWRVSAETHLPHLRGLRLLRENLSRAQGEQLDRHGYFEVTGGQTGKRYRIKCGCQMNVQQLDQKGRPVCELCFVPEGGLTAGDVMLAQKLALELFEGEALLAANKRCAARSAHYLLP
jgi:hypothetical protein